MIELKRCNNFHYDFTSLNRFPFKVTQQLDALRRCETNHFKDFEALNKMKYNKIWLIRRKKVA